MLLLCREAAEERRVEDAPSARCDPAVLAKPSIASTAAPAEARRHRVAMQVA
jgi:hypothetical protein